jgi:sugar/nucleoside kinase (ribokinase family)
MEGCSFVNGGSQNTICKGLTELAKQQLGVYCLGTDFKAGQTKFKTAAVEYLRTMGLTPKVIASSNHLGNNDMHNLATGDAARKAKLRVKHDIFAAWEEDIDHKVSVMYTPMINDEKRDFVEYTSLGFLSQHHTMVTYTRASDSVLCVPLMIDAAVWIDFFSRKSWSYENVAKALAYLFKVPEGAAKGVDPGFFRQMQELDRQLLDVSESASGRKKNISLNEIISTKRVVKFKEKETGGAFFTEWNIPNDLGIICAGLACVDMQLLGATGGGGGESIETFQGEKSMGGGSVSMACKNLSRLSHLDPLEDVYMQVTPPVVSSIVPLCKIGFDNAGNNLINFLESVGDLSKNIETKYMKNARIRDPNARTALAVLPIYQDGRRGCFFDAASNATFAANELVEMMEEACNNEETSFGAFLFGYPHLLPKMQGEALAHIFSRARSLMENGGIVVLDLNGVPESEKQITPFGSMCSASTLADDPVIGPALSHTDILHLNEDELKNLTGISFDDIDEKQANDSISKAASLFLECGVAVVAVTRGKKGCYIKCNDENRFSSSKMLPSSWVDKEIQVEASLLPPDTEINSNGAGDAFTSGLLVAAMLRHTGLVENPIETNLPLKSSVNNDDDLLDSTVSIGTMSPKKLTPYTLYMKENYMALKSKYSEDRTALFSKCNELWDEESEEVKTMYERKCEEEIERLQKELASVDAMEENNSDSTPLEPTVDLHLANQPMALETAAQFASLVAARHIDMSTRDTKNLNINRIREASCVSSYGLEEI